MPPQPNRLNPGIQTVESSPPVPLPPLRPSPIDSVAGYWRPGLPLGLLFFDIRNYASFEHAYGLSVGENVLRLMEKEIERAGREALADADFVRIDRVEQGGFIALFRRPGLTVQSMADLAAGIRLSIRRALNEEIVQLTGRNLDVGVGYAQLHPRADAEPARVLYHGLCDAREVARGAFDVAKLGLMEEFRRIVELPRLTAVYMPIVDLRTGVVLGWEALTRGPAGTRFQSPSVLFDFAEEVGDLFSLERACRLQAIRGVGELHPDQRLFINIHPHTVADPNFTPGETRRLLEEHGLHPQQLVFEITERHRIRDFSLFFQTLEHYRAQGYQAAIDDVGAGYSGLWTLAQVRPEFVKIDMSLVRGVDSNPVNRALLETLVNFADKIGSRIIAEGIETETELTCLMNMGVHYGQGFFLAPPSRPKPPSRDVLPFRPVATVNAEAGSRCSTPIGNLAEPAIQLGPEIKISEVRDILENAPPSPISGVVVAEDDRPLGLIMSHDLNRRLGKLYGVALYYERSITRLMDPVPLILDHTVPVEIAAEKAMNREKHKVYDHIIVTRDSRLCGVVSVQKMLDTLARVQVEMAKGANPLTGLPGNVAIEREFEDKARSGRPFCLIYADLDHFKVFNDKYGFENGDRMILLLARIVAWAVKRRGGEAAFLGHVGGDDFILMCGPDHAERVCRAVIRCFQRLSPGLHSPEDRAKGFIKGKNRDGERRKFPITSVSLAIVDCRGEIDLNRLARRAAEMKKYAKSKPGNVYVRDRRSFPEKAGS